MYVNTLYNIQHKAEFQLNPLKHCKYLRSKMSNAEKVESLKSRGERDENQ